MVDGLLAVVGDHDALAGRERVVLDDVGRAECIERVGDLLGGLAHVREGCRHLRCGHDLLGERLGPLELGGLTARAEARDAGSPHGVGHAGHQRSLGPDDDEVGTEGRRQRRDGSTVERVDVVPGGDRLHAGVAGGDVYFGDVGVTGQRERQRVLAAAGADDESPHGQPA
jgi:hypothetical protein